MVTVSVEGRVALIVINNPPVNALSQPVRRGLLVAIKAADADTNICGIVLRGAGRAFIAGADIKELGRPAEMPQLPEVTEAIENATKPVVAAIHGSALGGGFEIALACHYRLAARGSKVGLPEVTLGILPGSGGTQRLPRLVGFERAIRMIAEGSKISATDALAWGALDEVLDTEDDQVLAEHAVNVARRLSDAGVPLRRVGQLAVPTADLAMVRDVTAEVSKQFRGAVAPQVCIEAILEATRLPLRDALQRERELFLALRDSEQAEALRYAFFGEREVARPPNLSTSISPRSITRAAVIGAGTMGTGIAMCFANAGIPVSMLDESNASLERGVGAIRRTYDSAVARTRLSRAEGTARLGMITPTLSYADLGDADVVVEAVFEDIDTKRQVFERLDAVAKPGAILATNTSYLDVSAIASFTGRAADVVGLHFFSPANVMRLLEVVRHPSVAPEHLATAMTLGRRLGKIAVLVAGSDGFVGNRMLAQRTRESYFLLEEGALPDQIDRVLVEFGFPMGPFAVGDLAGLDIGWRRRKATAHLRLPGVRDSLLLDKLCELGRFGQKTGRGWYRYEEGDRTPHRDPDVEQLIVDHSRTVGITRRNVSDDEILERCVYALINEGGRVLDDGVAEREVDVDMIWVHGYGFPAYRGGPLFYARQLGYDTVLERLRALERRFGSVFWKPSEWLQAKALGSEPVPQAR